MVIKRLLTNKFVLYFTVFLALLNVIGYIQKNDMKALTIQDYDNVREKWRERDRVAKFLGIWSSPTFQIEKLRNQMTLQEAKRCGKNLCRN